MEFWNYFTGDIQIFTDPNNHGLTAFDYRSAQTCVVAQDNGDVLLMDLRVE